MILKPNNKLFLHIAHISHHIVLVFPEPVLFVITRGVYCVCEGPGGVTAVIYTRDSPATSSIALSRVHQERNRSLTATWSWTYFYKCSLNVFLTTYLRFPFQEWAHRVYKATLWLSTLYTVMYIIHRVPLSVSHRTCRKEWLFETMIYIVCNVTDPVVNTPFSTIHHVWTFKWCVKCVLATLCCMWIAFHITMFSSRTQLLLNVSYSEV